MRKLIPATLILIALIFSGCSSDLNDNNEDAALSAQILGKWKLTEYSSDDQPVNTPIANGYEIEFKADKTFISNEENGFTGGNYTILRSPGNNLMLVYKKSWEAKSVYKYINSVDTQHIYIQPSQPEPTPEGGIFFTGYVLTRIP